LAGGGITKAAIERHGRRWDDIGTVGRHGRRWDDIGSGRKTWEAVG